MPGFRLHRQVKGPKVAVLAVSDRSIKADGVSAHGQDPSRFLDRRFATFGNFFQSGFATKFL